MAGCAGRVARGRGHHRSRHRCSGVRAVPASAVARERVPRAHKRHGGGAVIRIVRAELLKFTTTRTFWALAASAVGLVLLIVVLTLIIDDTLGSEEDVRSLLNSAGIYGLLTLILGVVAGA